ncbi:outer membrane protein assembly factor BamB family protein [Cellulomonas gilvus]|uniref:outer membrane protein assembly factor BamB family protein n=1 Tax=Cellulomonas gilvus TaxID=11 RepID=UPI001FDF9F38|nr:PQQ-binding-like beta-propeller repeat protein [Cellulomonas gilvus]
MESPDPYAAVAFQQGPLHDGRSVDPSFTGPLTEAWSVTLHGTVSYPLIADGIVYALYSDPRRLGRSVVALSARSGEVVWGPRVVGGYTESTSAFAFDAGRVFVMSDSGGLMALDATTGHVAWNIDLPSQRYFDGPPTARDGVVYVVGSGSGGTLFAVDQGSGNVLWTADLATGSASSPTVSDNGIFLSFACERIYRFALDGAPVWSRHGPCSGGGGSTSVLHDGRLHVRGFYVGRPMAVVDALTASDLAFAAVTSWTTPAFDDTHMVAVANGHLTVHDARSGVELWRAPTNDNTTPPLIVNGYVVEGRADGTIDMRDVETGALVWRGKARGPIPQVIEGADAPLRGMAQGDGVLAVPAGSTLTVFEPAGDTTVRLEGPAAGSSVGPGARFVFSSGVRHARYVCTVDGVDRECTSPWSPAGLGDGSHTLGVRVAYATVGAVSTRFTLDATSPKVSVAPFSSAVIHTSTTRARWSAIDRGTGVKAYQVRVGRAPVGKPIRSWKVRARSQATSATFSVPRATRLCVSVRAGDLVGNWSGWSSPRCVNRA